MINGWQFYYFEVFYLQNKLLSPFEKGVSNSVEKFRLAATIHSPTKIYHVLFDTYSDVETHVYISWHIVIYCYILQMAYSDILKNYSDNMMYIPITQWHILTVNCSILQL